MWRSAVSDSPEIFGLEVGRGRLLSSAIERRCLQLLAISNSAAIILAAGAAKILYIDFGLGVSQAHVMYLVPSCILALIVHYAFKQFGLHSISSLTGPTLSLDRVATALSLSFLTLLGGMYLSKVAEDYSRGWFLIWFVFSATALVLIRWCCKRSLRALTMAGRLRRNVALIGTAEFTDTIKAELEKESPSLAITVACLPTREAGDPETDMAAILALKNQMRTRGIEQVVIAMPATDQLRIRAALRQLAPYSQEILLCTEPRSYPVPVHGSKAIGRFRAEVASPVPAAETDRLEKRIFDVVLATFGLVTILPLMLIVALLIKLDSPGPVFFLQRRYGRNNQVFRIFKFRTMHVAEDGDRVDQAVRHDARVTRVGRFLRASSIDELPQLINVLIGDMSLVGPRPHALVHEESFEARLDLFSLRRRVLPGITGWAQVNGCRGETTTLQSVEKRMEYDLYYIDNWSIWLDMEILARTVTTTLRGAY